MLPPPLPRQCGQDLNQFYHDLKEYVGIFPTWTKTRRLKLKDTALIQDLNSFRDDPSVDQLVQSLVTNTERKTFMPDIWDRYYKRILKLMERMYKVAREPEKKEALAEIIANMNMQRDGIRDEFIGIFYNSESFLSQAISELSLFKERTGLEARRL